MNKWGLNIGFSILGFPLCQCRGDTTQSKIFKRRPKTEVDFFKAFNPPLSNQQRIPNPEVPEKAIRSGEAGGLSRLEQRLIFGSKSPGNLFD
jgi:hypothetical protein